MIVKTNIGIGNGHYNAVPYSVHMHTHTDARFERVTTLHLAHAFAFAIKMRKTECGQKPTHTHTRARKAPLSSHPASQPSDTKSNYRNACYIVAAIDIQNVKRHMHKVSRCWCDFVSFFFFFCFAASARHRSASSAHFYPLLKRK